MLAFLEAPVGSQSDTCPGHLQSSSSWAIGWHADLEDYAQCVHSAQHQEELHLVLIFGSMPRGALAGKDCFHARLLGLAMFGKPRSAALSKVRTSSGSRQDAVGLTVFYAQISQFQKTELYLFLNVFRIFQGSPKMVGIVLFSNFFRILINLQYLAVSGPPSRHGPIACLQEVSVRGPDLGARVLSVQGPDSTSS